MIEGNTWTFPWSNTEAGKTTYFRVVNVWSSRARFRDSGVRQRTGRGRVPDGHLDGIRRPLVNLGPSYLKLAS